LLEDTVGVARELIPNVDIPELKFPPARMVKKGENTYYTIPLPPEIGLDQRLMPVLGLSKNVAAYTLSQDQAERLLANKPLQTKGTALADPSKPLLSATVFDWPALLDAAVPWVEFGVRSVVAEARPIRKEGVPKKEEFRKEIFREGDKERGEKERGDKGPLDGADKQVKEIMTQVKAVVEVLKVYKGTTTATYPEEGRIVTHSVAIIRDLGK
jgi:hypothetical protein